MNPSNNQSAGVSLPVSTDGQTSGVSSSNNNPGVPPPTPSNQATPATLPLATIPLPLPATPSSSPPLSQQPLQTATAQALSFQVADDKDVIEPEWVNKAKSIVDQTSDDPYKQSEELTVFKADYMQKRYNKTIKLK